MQTEIFVASVVLVLAGFILCLYWSGARGKKVLRIAEFTVYGFSAAFLVLFSLALVSDSSDFDAYILMVLLTLAGAVLFAIFGAETGNKLYNNF